MKLAGNTVAASVALIVVLGGLLFVLFIGPSMFAQGSDSSVAPERQ